MNLDRHDASLMVTGCPQNKYKGFNTFSDAREWLSKVGGHNNFHFWQGPMDGPKTNVNEHSGRPAYYLATDGQDADIFENYEYEILSTSGFAVPG